MVCLNPLASYPDHCRIGSLEMDEHLDEHQDEDHCRIGSLEIPAYHLPYSLSRSLPHRQLRKIPQLARHT